MRTTRAILAAVLLATLVGLCGCGGGAGGVATADISGVWIGDQTRASDGTVEYDFTRSGATLTGTVRLTATDLTVYTGTFTGTFTGNTVDVTTTWTSPPGYGTTHFVGTVTGNQLSGSYTHTPPGGAAESGNVTLKKSNVTTPVNLGGHYTGTSKDLKNGNMIPIDVTLTQTGDTFTGTITISGDGQSISGTLGGTVIGDHITLGSGALNGQLFNFDGKVAGQAVSGTWIRTDDSSHHGTFTMSKAQ